MVMIWGSPPIGKITEVYEDAKGLAFTATLPKDDDFVKGRIAHTAEDRRH